MIWKNPFLSKNSEHQFRVEEFLALFDCTVLEMINEQNLSKVSYISSTPGAGKTSLFRAFSPQVLSTIRDVEGEEKYKDIKKQMERLGVIKEHKILLLSANLSFARNYSIIDEMFQNGRRKQVFFALLNYRIAISLIRSIGALLDIEKDEYERITFIEIPQEMTSEFEDLKNARMLYDWACNGEKELCRCLDSDRINGIDISFIHTTLLILKLFEPENILIDDENQFISTVMIFDDFHKLSENQRIYVSEALYTLKSNTGVWLGQRLEGMRSTQLVSMDGSLSRDYNPDIVIDNYWPKRQKQFYLMLENIADRRLKESDISSYGRFSDCITNQIENKRYNKTLKIFIQSVYNDINSQLELQIRYKNILERIENENDIFRKAICYECIVIREKRRNEGQLTLFLGEPDDPDSFMNDFVKTNENAAKFYLCRRCKIPFYCGMSNLMALASYNVEQFLVFAGSYFECCRVKLLGEGTSRKKRHLSIEEQNDVLNEVVKNQWNDMDLRYPNIDRIKNFLNNVAKFCCASRDAERNSYAGGAYTGFAIKNVELKRILDDSKYSELIDILASCLASKYLEKKNIYDGDECVFYLNRWLCVYYELPIAYGGWKHVSVNSALAMCFNSENALADN